MPLLRGKEGWREFKREKKRQKNRMSAAFKWFLKPGEKRKGTILDKEVTFFAYEHTIKIGPKQYESVICRRSAPDSDDHCPPCEEKIPRSFTIYLTIVDHKAEVDKRGRKHQYQKKLLCAKGDAIDVIKTKLEKMGSLRLTKWEIQRGSADNSPNVGTIWELIKTYEKADFLDLLKKKGVEKPSSKPLDYDKVLQIKTAEEMLDIMGKKDAAYGSDNDSEDIDDDDDERPAETKTPAKRPARRRRRRL